MQLASGRRESTNTASSKQGWLGAMTSGEAADAAPATLLIPLGATEQHGPHLPLHTDTIIAEAWAWRVAASLNEAGHRTVVAEGDFHVGTKLTRTYFFI